MNELNGNDLAVNVILTNELPNKLLASSAQNPFICADYWHEKGFNIQNGE